MCYWFLIVANKKTQIEMLGGTLEKIAEPKAKGHLTNAKRTAHEADLNKGLVQRRIAAERHTAATAEGVLRDITNQAIIVEDFEASSSSSMERTKRKNTWRAKKRAKQTQESFIPTSETDSSNTGELSTQASSSVIASTPIPMRRSPNSSLPLRRTSTQQLAGIFLSSTSAREEKRCVVQLADQRANRDNAGNGTVDEGY